ncbi:hypothetical protein F5Y16DRAFT_421855 [Xylariaceae sp. FL0255]|nr:hypothetical protein F5Y16DRAFT_421855 [Xylariaceae sp. FL0255]
MADVPHSLLERYKEYTKLVASWLYPTARGYGFAALPGHVMRVRDFVAAARHLPGQRNISVPRYVAAALDRAIDYRIRYSTNLQQRRETTTTNDRTQDAQHLHFIDVLTTVREILKSIPTPDVQTESEVDPLAKGLSAMNLARQATVEDVDEDDEKDQSPNAPEPALKSSEEVHFSPEQDDEDEALFQWHLFLQEAGNIRRDVQSLWQGYSQGALGLAGVSAAHAMALHRVLRMEQDCVFLKSHGGPETFFRRTWELGYANTPSGRKVKSDSDRLTWYFFKQADSENMDDIQTANKDLYYAWRILCRVVEHSKSSLWKQGSAKSNRRTLIDLPKEGNSTTTVEAARYFGYEHAIDAIFYEHALVQRYNENANRNGNIYLEELVSAINTLFPRSLPFKTDVDAPATLYSAFAWRLFLDSAQSFPGRPDKPSQEFLRENRRFETSLRSMGPMFEKNNQSKNDQNSLAEMSAALRLDFASCKGHVAAWAPGDPGAYLAKLGFIPNTKQRESLLLTHNPVLSGWLLFKRQNQVYRQTRVSAGSLQILLSCAHLYSAFKESGRIPEGTWPDMEVLIKLHRDDLWRTKSSDGRYATDLLFTCGLSLQTLAKDRRSPNVAMQKLPKRMLSTHSPVRDHIQDAFMLRGLVGLEEVDLDLIMAKTDCRWYNGNLVRPCRLHKWKAAARNSSQKDQPASQYVKLALIVEVEGLGQTFDYMYLTKVCQTLLKRISAAWSKRKPKDYLEDALLSGAHGIYGHALVGHVLLDVFESHGSNPNATEDGEVVAEIIMSSLKGVANLVHNNAKMTTLTKVDWTQECQCACTEIEKLTTK